MGPVRVTLAAFFLAGPVAAAMPFDPADTSWEGLHGLVEIARGALGEGRVDLAPKLDWAALGPSDGLLIVHPEQPLDGDELAAFLRAGGRVAIVDDFGAGDRILDRYQIRRIPAPSSPLHSLRDKPALAIAEPVTETLGGRTGAVHPVAADVVRLVTNHPSGFIHPDLSPVLRIRARDDADVTLALAGQVGKGRLFAMGDPSAVMNLMLRYPGNRAFAAGLVRYLVDDDAWGARQGKLRIVVGHFDETGSFGGGVGGWRAGREALRALKAELAHVESEGLPRGALLALGVALVGALAMWVVNVGARSYAAPTPRFARAWPLVAQGGVAGRAAVLAAPSTHRGLILLEQKNAFEDEIGALLGLAERPSMGRVLEELERGRLVPPALLAELRRAFLTTAKVETAMASGLSVRVDRDALAQIDRVGRAVCDAVAERRGKRLDPRPTGEA